MGIAFLHGNGGSGGGGAGGSELTIVGGTTRPAKPTQNMIWIDTDVEITAYTLSATAPEEPDDGVVWITISTDGPIKIASPVGDDWITVYPISAQQRINGEWIAKDTKNYQDGVWVEWLPEGALCWYGNECEHLTGGWGTAAWKVVSDATVNTQTFQITKGTGYLLFEKTGDYGAVMHTKNLIDLTNVKAIHFKGEMSPAARDYWVAFHVWTKIGGTSAWSDASKAAVKTVTSTGRQDFVLDVSALTGSYYLGFGIYSSSHSVKIEELYLEVA